MLAATVDIDNNGMDRELCFKSELRELGCDPRTAIKRYGIEPIGVIKIHGREFPVYDKAGIEAIKAQRALEESK